MTTLFNLNISDPYDTVFFEKNLFISSDFLLKEFWFLNKFFFLKPITLEFFPRNIFVIAAENPEPTTKFLIINKS